MKATIPESAWRNNQAVLPCGHPLLFDPKQVNHYGYLLEQKHKCRDCAVEYEYIVLDGWEAAQRQIAEAEGRLQTCPRRAVEWGPWEHGENLDFWETDRWGRHDTDVFPEGFPPPRTCSFCGGVHPEDAIALLGLGWEVQETTKGYKRYLHPPGYAANMEEFSEYHRQQVRGEKVERPKVRLPDPIPPVKVYVYHFSERGIEEFNAALSAKQGK